MVHRHEGTERCPVFMGSRLGPFVCCCLIEYHTMCENIMLIYALLTDGNYMWKI